MAEKQNSVDRLTRDEIVGAINHFMDSHGPTPYGSLRAAVNMLRADAMKIQELREWSLQRRVNGSLEYQQGAVDTHEVLDSKLNALFPR